MFIFLVNPNAIFITWTPANFHNHPPTPNIPARQQEGLEEEDGPLRRPDGRPVTPVDTKVFQTTNRVLDVLNEGEMDVAGFLDALSWGNPLAIADPRTRQARTQLTHSD